MPITATLITDRNLAEPPWIEENGDELFGQRNYLVNTHDEGAALTVLPALDSPWSQDRTDLVVVSRRTRYLARRDDEGAAPPTGGYTIGEVNYATPRAGGSVSPVPSLGLRYTELEFSDDTIVRKWDVRALTQPGIWFPIENGDGVPVLIGAVRARVITHVNRNTNFPWSRIIRLTRAKALNDSPIELPAIYGTSASFTMAIGQVRYEGIERPEVKNNVLQIVHVLSLAENFNHIWNLENPNGLPSGANAQVSQVYPFDNLAGLW